MADKHPKHAREIEYKLESCSQYERDDSMEVSGSHAYQRNPAYNAVTLQSPNKHLEETHFRADTQQPAEAIPVTNVVRHDFLCITFGVKVKQKCIHR